MTFASFGQDNKRILNMGCGADYVEGVINIDYFARKIDIRHDLDSVPYPFGDSEFDEIWCYNIIEHLNDIFATMKEIHRIGKPGCVVRIRVPHFRSACLYEDITHRRGFAWKSFDLFSAESSIYGEYTQYKFSITGRAYTPYKIKLLYKWLSGVPVLTDNLLSKYIPMASILFTLRVDK